MLESRTSPPSPLDPPYPRFFQIHPFAHPWKRGVSTFQAFAPCERVCQSVPKKSLTLTPWISEKKKILPPSPSFACNRYPGTKKIQCKPILWIQFHGFLLHQRWCFSGTAGWWKQQIMKNHHIWFESWLFCTQLKHQLSNHQTHKFLKTSPHLQSCFLKEHIARPFLIQTTSKWNRWFFPWCSNAC